MAQTMGGVTNWARIYVVLRACDILPDACFGHGVADTQTDRCHETGGQHMIFIRSLLEHNCERRCRGRRRVFPPRFRRRFLVSIP